MLAIIIPYFKLAFFRETLKSVAAQTDQRFKVYISNDASPEDPEAVLSEFEGKLEYVYKKFAENIGSSSLTRHWERCIGLIEDEKWFVILGDDDMISEQIVEKFYENLPIFDVNCNVVRYSSQVIDEKGNPAARRYYQPEYEDAIHSYYRKLTGENRGSLSEFIFRRSQYEKFKFKNYPLAWTADDRAVIDFSEGKAIYSINDAVVYFRKSELHISSRTNDFALKHQAQLQSMKDLIADYKNKMDKEKLVFFIHLYENHVLSFKHVQVKYYAYLFYLYYRYMKRKDIIVLHKSLIAKLLP